MAEPTPYYIFTGEAAYDNFGETMAPAGDIDNDGFDDIIIGASRHDGAAVNTGRVYVFSGRTGDTLHIFDGEASLDEFGTAVSGAGDVDNDGYADIIIGAPYFGSNAGRAYVFSGQTGDTLQIFTGDQSDRYLGFAVASAGDLNHDGYADLMVGGLWGYTYVFSGLNSDTLFKLVIGRALASLGDVDQDSFDDLIISPYSTSPKAFIYSGQSGGTLKVINLSGSEVTWLRLAKGADLNDDNVPEIIVGYPQFDDGGPSYTNKGIAYVYSGQTGAILYTFMGSAGGRFLGTSVSFGCDIDGDKYEDILIGSSGEAFVFSGRTGDTLYAFTGDLNGDSYYQMVSSAGDINNDGFDDFMLRAKGLDSLGNNVDKVYVYLGFNCGDANSDNSINIGDAVFLLNYIFKVGPAPEPLDVGDTNCDGPINIGDAVYLINYIFRSGPEPCASCP